MKKFVEQKLMILHKVIRRSVRHMTRKHRETSGEQVAFNQVEGAPVRGS